MKYSTLLFLNLIFLYSYPMVSAQNGSFDFDSHTQLVLVNGESFPCVDFGEGPVVLLLHGFPDTRHLWQEQIPALAAAGFRVLAPDLRGAGEAPRPLGKEAYALPRLMGDVIGIMDALEVEKAHLVGHDWGAALAWALATYQQKRFLSLVAMSVGAPGNSGWKEMAQREKSWYFYFFLQEGLAEREIRANNWAFMKEFLQSHPDRKTILPRLADSTNLTTALNWYRGNLQGMLAPRDGSSTSSDKEKTESVPLPPEIKLPVLGLWSENDNFLLEPQMKLSSQVVRHAFVYQKVKEAGHWMMRDQATTVNAILIDFLHTVIISPTE
jgi:pimeloyl-ACP methyl ester carboxylesterase